MRDLWEMNGVGDQDEIINVLNSDAFTNLEIPIMNGVTTGV